MQPGPISLRPTPSSTPSDQPAPVEPGAWVQPPSSDEQGEVAWRFGPYLLRPAKRRLEHEGDPVRIGMRALEVLAQLLLHAGEVISKDELLCTVWSGLVVDDSSVRVQMSLLRKTLREPEPTTGLPGWIATVPARGYVFIGQVQRVMLPPEPQDEPRPASPCAPDPWPQPAERLTRLVGRERELTQLCSALQSRRLVTVVGAGGVGKSSLATSAAALFCRAQQARLGYVDLAALAANATITLTDALAMALGAAYGETSLLHRLPRARPGSPEVLILDNCEHLADELAALLPTLLSSCAGLQILATSREPLRIDGEQILHLQPLALPVPAPSAALTLEQTLAFPAVELFVERAHAAGIGTAQLSPVQALVELCHLLDGVPLAIEIVASQLSTQGLSSLARQAAEQFPLQAAGRRGGAPRHRSLAASLDWSIAALNDAEARLLGRLSVFKGPFDIEAALQVGTDRHDETASVCSDALMSLVAKSLVCFDPGAAHAPYRLLGATRCHARALLQARGETDAALLRHALWALGMAKRREALPSVKQADEHDDSRRDELHAALEEAGQQQDKTALQACLDRVCSPGHRLPPEIRHSARQPRRSPDGPMARHRWPWLSSSAKTTAT
jgi:predicted ATPase/DNA-binding winged helix-turn-helix (wHTH) protein